MIRRPAATLALALLLAAGLSGCSEIRALAPVSGDSVTSVRNAVNVVLVDQDIDILAAPVCGTEGSGFSCRGSTVDGAAIVATASGSAPYDLTITVGDETIFTGTAQGVLEKALQEP